MYMSSYYTLLQLFLFPGSALLSISHPYLYFIFDLIYFDIQPQLTYFYTLGLLVHQNFLRLNLFRRKLTWLVLSWPDYLSALQYGPSVGLLSPRRRRLFYAPNAVGLMDFFTTTLLRPSFTLKRF